MTGTEAKDAKKVVHIPFIDSRKIDVGHEHVGAGAAADIEAVGALGRDRR